MASTFQPFPMEATYLQHSLSVDSRRSFFDDDDEILDENILDNSLLDSNAEFDRRLGSPNTIFSPDTNDWDFDHDMGMPAGPADDSAAAAPAVTFENSTGSNNPFIKLEQAQPAYAQQHNAWSSSNVATPTAYNNGFSGPFDDNAYLAPAMPGPVSAFESVHIQPHAVFTPGAMAASVPSSPPDKDWTQAGPNDHGESHAIKRMRPSSPTPRAHSPLHVVRRDGIRKKNARFDIPAERTLMNIDQLIARSQDENEIKELKQQKRLLRNRQAALDSRQRKKQHTERLEEEKKLHNVVITELEDKLQAMTMRDEKLHQTLQEVARERDYLAHKTETFIMEKEEMVRAHTLETGELRKKNAYLTDQLQKMEDAMNRNPPSNSSNYGDYSIDNDFDLAGDCWDDPMSIQSPQMPTVKSEKPEQAAAPGVLLILLLCGALVASKTASISSLPPLPKGLQTASANVLQNIFNDAGVGDTRVAPVAATQTSDAWAVAKSDAPRMIGLDSSIDMLNSLGNGKPTAEQQHAQFMELTPAEYNGVTSNDFLREPEPTVRHGRSRIEESLAALRSNSGSKPSAAEVYTRSLLWDRVDAEVVRQFAAIARQAQELPATSNDDGGAAANS